MKSVVRITALVTAMGAGTSTAPNSYAGAYVFAGEGNGVDVVAHPTGYLGLGGNVEVEVCIVPGTPNAASMEVSMQNIVDRFNLLVPTLGNLKFGNDSDAGNAEIDFESVALHEVGHCIGLAHPNLATESGVASADRNYTKTTDGADNTFDLDEGSDNVKGSADDGRGDDVNLHWFEIDVNDPFVTTETPDSANYSRDVADLPSGDDFAANADRDVSSLLGYPLSEAVMQQGSFFGEDQRALGADDVTTLRHARAGADRDAGDGDDYTVTLTYGGISNDVGCDVNLSFDDTETGFAVCKLTGAFINGTNIRITSANSFYNTGFNWHYSSDRIPLPAADNLEVVRGGSTSALTNADDSVLDNDIDQENNVADLVVSTTPTIEPQAGSVVLNTDGTFTYTHGGGVSSGDQFVYEVCIDGSNTCSHQYVYVNVLANQSPQAVDDALTVAEGESQNRLDGNDDSLLDNDSDPDGDNLSVSASPISDAAHGDVVLAANGKFSYTHDGSENFNDQFQYEVCDDTAPPLCAVATVDVVVTEVNDPPVATGESLPAVAEDSGQTDIQFADLIGNDSAGAGEDGTQTLTVSDVSNPTGGTVGIFNGRVRFTPTDDFNGTAQFTYTVTDDGTTDGSNDPLTAQATATFDITEVNDPPVATADGLGDQGEDSGVRRIPLNTLTGNDAPGPGNESAQTLTVTAVGNAVGGAVTLDGADAVFSPAADYYGPASFDYTVEDDGTTSGSADPRSAGGQVSWDITEANDPPVAEDDALPGSLAPGASRTFLATDLLANDAAGPTNESAQTLTVTAVGNAIGGSVSLLAGSITFIANGDFQGLAGFDYTVTDDGETDASPDPANAAGRATIVVQGGNLPPFARADVVVVARGDSASVLLDKGASLLDNDDELDGEAIEATAVSDAVTDQGTVSVAQDGSFTYQHGGGAGDFDTFDYEVCDAPAGNCATATVTVVVTDNASPACSSTGRRAQVGVPLAIAFESAFPSGNLDYDVSGLPPSLSLDEAAGIVSGVPTENDVAGSPYLIEFSAGDGNSTLTARLLLTIEPSVDAFFYDGFDGFCAPR